VEGITKQKSNLIKKQQGSFYINFMEDFEASSRHDLARLKNSGKQKSFISGISLAFCLSYSYHCLIPVMLIQTMA